MGSSSNGAERVIELLEGEVGPCASVIGVGVEDEDLVARCSGSAGWMRVGVLWGFAMGWYLAIMVSIKPVLRTIKSYSRSSMVGSAMMPMVMGRKG